MNGYYKKYIGKFIRQNEQRFVLFLVIFHHLQIFPLKILTILPKYGIMDLRTIAVEEIKPDNTMPRVMPSIS